MVKPAAAPVGRYWPLQAARYGITGVPFFVGADGTPTSPGHVGLVIGGGKMIEAYATGFPIRVASYTDRDPVGFTRPWATASTIALGSH